MKIAKEILFGVAIGDALGVPFEFRERSFMKKNAAKDMVGYGTYNQKPGTWSDDSSLTFCLAESLIENYTLRNASEKFIKWKEEAYWTARNELFDIGFTTSNSISELKNIIESEELSDLKRLKYLGDEFDNGNGSLMRILPFIYEIKGKTMVEQFDLIWLNSALTHKHIRSAIACHIYLTFCLNIIQFQDKFKAYKETQKQISSFLIERNISAYEIQKFERILVEDISILEENVIESSGYVIHSLEASIWSILTSETFEESVLKSINLGHDTDTTGAITGGIAGILYGFESIPEFWVVSLARMEAIFELSEKLEKKYDVSS